MARDGGAVAEGALHIAPGEDRGDERSGNDHDAREAGEGLVGRIFGKDDQRPVPQIERVGDEADADQRGKRKQAGGAGARRGVYQRRCAEHRGQGGDAGEDGGAIIEGDGEGDGEKAAPGQRFPGPARADRRDRAERRERAREQFPGAGGEEVESEAARVALKQDGERERDGGDARDRRRAPAGGIGSEQHQEQREADIILLLHRERPCVEQRLHVRTAREIAGVGEEPEVGSEDDGGERGLGHAFEVAREIEPGGAGQHDEDHQRQRGDDAAEAALVEAQEREAAGVDLPRDDRRDEIARYDEEDVDADIAARKAGDMRVEQQHRQDRERAQPVYVAAIAGRRMGAGRGRVHGAGVAGKP